MKTSGADDRASAPLLGALTKRYTDRSTAKKFVFSFYCDKCGREWRSTPQAFDLDGLAPPIDLQVFRMLWNDRHKAAYEQANLEAIRAFNRCPACGLRVCMECFYESEADGADICRDCLAEQNESTRKRRNRVF